MEAHALVARLNADTRIRFPFLCLLASGGHLLLLIVHGIGRYTQLGTTLDDSLGEAYDKVARLLGLDLRPSGGAVLEAFANEGDPYKYKFKVPMLKYKNCDFSYSGLKTAVRLAVEKLVMDPNDASKRQVRADIAASFQHVAIQHLEERCSRACEWALSRSPDITTFVVSGGVASNMAVRDRLQAVANSSGLELVTPPPRLCTDNGVMVAWAGLERYQLGLHEPPPAVAPTEDDWVEIRARWPLTEDKVSSGDEYVRIVRKKRLVTSLTTMDSMRDSQMATE
ncbi:unnamed protein product [Ostreobium quekettii]|uniref:N(6)-L-threonylcarbamoyladenine synthase n=1 Tax=Ostreobium quekettii TaxID=121088 RepID=A0A8S1IPL4_9CHLO|nr:unnamed protein product [Ostreobium quekettii]